MQYKLPLFLLLNIGVAGTQMPVYGQNDTIAQDHLPTILYNGNPQEYKIASIKVEGVKGYEDYVLVGISGLSVGQTIMVPGDDITQSVKRYWKHGLFSDVRITAEKIEGDKIYLKITLKQRPRIADLNFLGVKKSEREDLEKKLGLAKGSQITPNLIDRTKILTKRYFDDKGFKNAEIRVTDRPAPGTEEQVIVDISVDKKEKVKIHAINIEGNSVLSDRKLKKVMKKTKEKNKFRNIFSTKKFIQARYEEDKENIIKKYNELGYRDAYIEEDSVTSYDDRSVDITMRVHEGRKYYIRNISWIGNTTYATADLANILRMKSGDVYNQKLLAERTTSDEDAIGNLYYNKGYVFFNIDPVEVHVDNDSVDLEMRIVEGPQATIDKVRITGNDRLYEDVVRRELRTRPGDLFSKEALERTYREIAQMGHFNPENIKPDVQPDYTNGTVNIDWKLESKANDQVELSAGWGNTGVIGKVSLKFTNFSMANLFSKNKKRRGFLPQGDGETLTLSAQSNGSYYQSYGISYANPWFGGKRPNTFSVSTSYSVQTGINNSYYNSNYYQNYYNAMYGTGYNSGTINAYDPNQSLKIFNFSLGWGKRLRWPDDYFTFSTSLTYQRFMLKNWRYLYIRLNNGQELTSGHANEVSLTFNLARNSTDNPIYPRSGSEFSLSLQVTPPYSLFSNKDYSTYGQNNAEEAEKMFRWLEYHKWKLKWKSFTSLTRLNKTPVLMTRVEFGLLGHYNKYKKSPFGTFYMGGDGMSGYGYNYASETIALRGYDNGALTPFGSEGYAYARLGAELRYPLMLESSTSIYALAFVEAGNAWNNVSNFNPTSLKRSAGVGVRIFLPMVGMMGIDWAYGFDKTISTNTKGGSQFHFIIGQEF